MNSKLKQIIFKKLYSDLSHVEMIIHTDGSLWFIDREKKYWYLEFQKSGSLWWRLTFFSSFFKLFSLEVSEYEPIIAEWVEDVLNQKVVSTTLGYSDFRLGVEDVLNQKVVSTFRRSSEAVLWVEDVLNQKVVSTNPAIPEQLRVVEDVLNQKVVSTLDSTLPIPYLVEYLLNNNI